MGQTFFCLEGKTSFWWNFVFISGKLPQNFRVQLPYELFFFHSIIGFLSCPSIVRGWPIQWVPQFSDPIKKFRINTSYRFYTSADSIIVPQTSQSVPCHFLLQRMGCKLQILPNCTFTLLAPSSRVRMHLVESAVHGQFSLVHKMYMEAFFLHNVSTFSIQLESACVDYVGRICQGAEIMY
jgi:hypothetical protein